MNVAIVVVALVVGCVVAFGLVLCMEEVQMCESREDADEEVEVEPPIEVARQVVVSPSGELALVVEEPIERRQAGFSVSTI